MPLEKCIKITSSSTSGSMSSSSASPRIRSDGGGGSGVGNEGDSSEVIDGSPGESNSSSSVKFSVVEIREFERVVGDNPSCSSGVPIR